MLAGGVAPGQILNSGKPCKPARAGTDGGDIYLSAMAHENIAPFQGLARSGHSPGASPPADILRPFRAANH